LVLVYHRVAEREPDPWSLCVKPRHFAEHAELLRGRVKPLATIARNGSGAAAIALTFDDGYADALHAAKPLLERYALPASVFVATGGVDDGRPFWWDELEGLLRPPHPLPAALELRVGDVRRRFDVDLAPRTRLLAALQHLLGGLEEAERREQLATLHAWAGTAAAETVCDRPLDREEIARLGAGGLVEIGAHSVSHPRLPSLPVATQTREVRGSRDFLEQVLGRRVTSFAYPHGLESAATRRILREAGFERACTTTPGLVHRRADPLRIPRIEAPACDGEGFARFLHRLGF
jgi:peptidoglycan/xylan/chitin deacetylase (PgdA/CDA1 family)